MAFNDPQTPDLASVLSTLAQYGPRAPLQSSNSFERELEHLDHEAPDSSPATELEDGEYDPAESLVGRRRSPLLQSDGREAGERVATQGVADQRQKLPRTDPASIIDWPGGLQHVMKTVSRSEAVMARMRKMVQVQHEHERQWWTGREQLLEKQKARVEGRRKLDDVLRTVGGQVTQSSSPAATDEDDSREMILYDAKIYRASLEMVNAMSDEFKSLGVPFFGTRKDLIRRKDIPPGDERGDGSGVQIHEDDLLKLQRRMIELLEDLSKE